MALVKINNNANGVMTDSIVMDDLERHLSTFSAKSVGMLTQRMTNVYDDPISATIRETVSNAIDATIALGDSEEWRPVEIMSPSAFEPRLTITDHGIGMSKDDVNKHFTQYGASTKEHDLSAVGAYGLGSKAPLAYTSSFNVDTVKDGVKTSFMMAREHDVIMTTILDVRPTSEPHGTTVYIPVQSYDVSKFLNVANKYAAYADDGVDITVDGAHSRFSDSWLRVCDVTLDKDTGATGGLYMAKRYITDGTAKRIIADAGVNARSMARENTIAAIGGWPYDYTGNSWSSKYFLVKLIPGVVDFSTSRDSITKNNRLNALIDNIASTLGGSGFAHALWKALGERLALTMDAQYRKVGWNIAGGASRNAIKGIESIYPGVAEVFSADALNAPLAMSVIFNGNGDSARTDIVTCSDGLFSASPVLASKLHEAFADTASTDLAVRRLATCAEGDKGKTVAGVPVPVLGGFTSVMGHAPAGSRFAGDDDQSNPAIAIVDADSARSNVADTIRSYYRNVLTTRSAAYFVAYPDSSHADELKELGFKVLTADDAHAKAVAARKSKTGPSPRVSVDHVMNAMVIHALDRDSDLKAALSSPVSVDLGKTPRETVIVTVSSDVILPCAIIDLLTRPEVVGRDVVIVNVRQADFATRRMAPVKGNDRYAYYETHGYAVSSPREFSYKFFEGAVIVPTSTDDVLEQCAAAGSRKAFTMMALTTNMTFLDLIVSDVIKEKLPERTNDLLDVISEVRSCSFSTPYRRRSSWFGVLKGDDDSPAARIVDHMLSTTVYTGEADAFRALDSYGTFREQVSKGLDAIIREHAPALLDDVR
jgi:hypothetical protein